MIYPLVRDLAAAGAPIRVPVAVTCRVLNIARQPYYRWIACPVTDAEWDEALLTNAIFDAHREDPEFRYRLIVDEVRDAGFDVAERTVWKICSQNCWWSSFSKKRSKNGKKAGPPVHDDLLAVVDKHGVTRHEFAAEGPDQLWLTDITEHPTAWIPAVVATPTGGVDRCQVRSTPKSTRTTSSSWSTGVAPSGLRLRPLGFTRVRPTPGCAMPV